MPSGSPVLPNKGDLCIYVRGNEVNAGFCFKAETRTVWLTAPGAEEALQFPMSSVMFWVPIMVMRHALNELDQPKLNRVAEIVQEFYIKTNQDEYTDVGDTWDRFTWIYKLLTGQDIDDIVVPEKTED